MTDRKDTGADPEVSAIRTVLGALEPLNADARERVIGFVFHRLGVSWSGALPGAPQVRSRADLAAATPTPIRGTESRPGDIRTLRQQKNPRSAIEMTALVAYYLENLAPPGERKGEFSGTDLVRYFKQAGFPLPKSPHMALINTKNAGYIDGAGRGLYRLNPVGHNLVAHALPREGESDKPPATRRKARKPKTRR